MPNVHIKDYQILIKADFLINLYDRDASEDAIKTASKNIFNTDTVTKTYKIVLKA